ncbi:hypothetical protein AB0M91_01450 [Micromonospora rifamycinica]|uniref:hypothetical protein n=1 Tax=Micromonospora rifamycinica TaxID=291594 RepID=UPI00343D72CE
MRKSISTLALLLSIAVVGTATPAVAAAADKSANRHCIGNLDTGRITCASDQQQARRLSGVSAAALTIAIFYDSTGYSTGAGTFTWTQSRDCTPGYDSEWQWDDLNSIGWGNRVSSVHTYNQCDVKFFNKVNFGGAASTWIDQSSNLANIGDGWNNRAGSVKFS